MSQVLQRHPHCHHHLRIHSGTRVICAMLDKRDFHFGRPRLVPFIPFLIASICFFFNYTRTFIACVSWLCLIGDQMGQQFEKNHGRIFV